MKRNKQLKRLTLFLVLSIVLIAVIIIQSASPMRQAKKQAVSVAKEIAKVERADDFYWFTREQTYFTVIGKNDKNEEKIVILPEDGKEAFVLDAKDGLTSEDAIQKILDLKETSRIKKASLGMFEGKPVWEIVARSETNQLNYYLVDFKDGDIVNKIKNL